jgi:hypothetical protein
MINTVDELVTLDSFASKELDTLLYRVKVVIALNDIFVSCGEMTRNKTKAGIVIIKANPNTSFVPGHST